MTLRSVALAAAGLVLLAGCGLTDRLDPSDPSSSTPSTTASETKEDLGTLTGAGRPLDEGGLRAALPAAADLGPGWEDDPIETVGEVDAESVDPVGCAPLLQKGPGWDEVRASERARVQDNFRADDNPPPPGSVRHHLAVWAYSFDDPYPNRLFDEAGEIIADCADFAVIQADTGNSSAYEASPLTFPTLGDRTLALRLKIGQTFETMTLDFVVVKVGHNTVTVANGTYNGTPDPAVTERAVRATLEGLEP